MFKIKWVRGVGELNNVWTTETPFGKVNISRYPREKRWEFKYVLFGQVRKCYGAETDSLKRAKELAEQDLIQSINDVREWAKEIGYE